MNVDAFRQHLLAEARAAAERLAAEADADASRQVQEATDQADEIRRRARREGREAARRQTRRQEADVRRRARQLVLGARRDGLDRLRRRVPEQLHEDRHEEDVAALTARLAALARRQLGEDAHVEPTPEGGGVIATSDGRLVDYGLAWLVDRAIEEMGTEVEELWR